MSDQKFPARSPRIGDDVTAQILRFHLYGLSQSEIARRVQCDRSTVARVLERSVHIRNTLHDLADEFTRALEVYRDLQRRALEAAQDATESGRSPVAALAEARQCQTRLDDLLGLVPLTPNDPQTELQSFKTCILTAISQVAPDSAPAIAQRLLAMAEGGRHDGA